MFKFWDCAENAANEDIGRIVANPTVSRLTEEALAAFRSVPGQIAVNVATSALSHGEAIQDERALVSLRDTAGNACKDTETIASELAPVDAEEAPFAEKWSKDAVQPSPRQIGLVKSKATQLWLSSHPDGESQFMRSMEMPPSYITDADAEALRVSVTDAEINRSLDHSSYCTLVNEALAKT